MAPARPEPIEELERIVLTEDLPAHRLQAGDIGTVVLVYADGKGYEVEFCTLSGETIDVVTVDGKQIRRAADAEIPHARRLAS